MKKRAIVLWVCRLVVAGILLQTLWFKFTAAPESVLIFSKLHWGTPGRIGVGLIELLIAMMILIPRTTLIGACLAFGTMSGAILSHFFVLGIVVMNDGGLLFGLALIVALTCVCIIWLNLSGLLLSAVAPLKHKHVLNDLVDLLINMKDKDFTTPLAILSDATIGEHVRHCIDMYNCVFDGYDKSLINYNARKRDDRVAAYLTNAIESLLFIIEQSGRSDKLLWLIDDHLVKCQTSFKREMLYCNEHSVHHMALIRIAIQQMGNYQLNKAFGVAPSTLKYRQACAQ